MKIKSLYISEYKTIKEQTFVFSDSLIALFVGQNGVGKSNLFEAISIIFEHLERSNSHPEFHTTMPAFDFELNYYCKGKEILLTSRSTNYNINIKDIEGEKFSTIEFNSFKPIRSHYIPEIIIAYYSGENKRVKTIYENHKKRWVFNIKQNSPSIKTPILGKMFFTDQNLGELIFLTLWLFKDSVRYRDLIHKLLVETLNIELDTKVSITFQNPPFSKRFPDKSVENLVENIYHAEEDLLWGLKGGISKLINLFVEHNQTSPIAYIDDQKSELKHVNEFVTFNNLDFISLSTVIFDHYEKPALLLDVLIACKHLNLIFEIESIISKNGQSINHSFMDLSEGEQQLLTVIGLILITGEYDTLFLLDEPDTHLNPKWQRDFAKLIDDFNLDKTNSHTLVATHSPLIVQSAENTDLFLFKKDSENQIKIDCENHTIHNWRIDQVLVSEYFDLPSGRPSTLDNYIRLKEEIINKYPFEAEDEARLATFENDFGVLPTGETKTEIKALQLMNQIIKTSR